MTVIKEYNTGTGQWETIVVGKQGPQGESGVVTSATAPEDTSVLWIDTTETPVTAVPSPSSAPGSVGQVLAAASTSPLETEWVSSGVPVGGASGQVLAKASATDYDTEWVAQATGAPITIEWWQEPDSETNFNTLSIDSACRTFGFRGTGTQANPSSASITYKVALSAGTYTLNYLIVRGASRGDHTITLGGTSVGVAGGYAAGVSRNVLVSFSGIAVSTAGVFDLEITNPTKDALSTGYRLDLQAITFVRTA